MRRKIESMPKEPLTKAECHHYWIIESPKGRTSKGVCKFCGVEKEFYNSWPYFMVDERTVKPSELTALKNNEPEEVEEGRQSMAPIRLPMSETKRQRKNKSGGRR